MHLETKTQRLYTKTASFFNSWDPGWLYYLFYFLQHEKLYSFINTHIRICTDTTINKAVYHLFKQVKFQDILLHFYICRALTDLYIQELLLPYTQSFFKHPVEIKTCVFPVD